jgi:hypothetical protein
MKQMIGEDNKILETGNHTRKVATNLADHTELNSLKQE